MKKIFTIMLTSLILVTMSACTTNNIKVAAEKKEQKKQVIVSGTVAISEMLEKLGVEMAGRPSTDEPISDNLKKIPDVGKPMSPDMERIKVLNPDVFLTTLSLKDSLGKKLEESGIKANYYSLASYNDIMTTIKSLSEEFGAKEEGDKLLKEYEDREKKVMESVKGKKGPKVMVIFGSPGNFTLATDKSYSGDIIKKLGAENIANSLGQASSTYMPFNMESALKQNPDIILRLAHANKEKTKQMFDKEFKENKLWQNFDAVKNNKVIDLDLDYFGVSGNIKAIDSLEIMKGLLYGEK